MVESANRKCVYCKGASGAKLSREHVISRSVLEGIFGPEIRNLTRLHLVDRSMLVDQQQTIRDVCRSCNQRLSEYDVAGVRLLASIHPTNDATCQRIPLSQLILGWLVKTHLNCVRMVSSAASGERYEVDHTTYDALVKFSPLPANKLHLFIEGWAGTQWFWDKDDPRKIAYFCFKSEEFKDAEILVSNLRIKWLDTFMLLPVNAGYGAFQVRTNHVRDQARQKLNRRWQEIQLSRVSTEAPIQVRRVVPLEEILQNLTKVE